jgi:hypothetical protein
MESPLTGARKSGIAAVLAGVAIGCASLKPSEPVRIVRASAEVASCRKVGDVSAPRRVEDRGVLSEVAEQARKIKGNTVLIDVGARSGAAYRCENPGVAQR